MYSYNLLYEEIPNTWTSFKTLFLKDAKKETLPLPNSLGLWDNYVLLSISQHCIETRCTTSPLKHHTEIVHADTPQTDLQTSAEMNFSSVKKRTVLFFLICSL